MKNNLSKIGLVFLAIAVLFAAANAQELETLECQVLEAEGAQLSQSGQNVALESDSTVRGGDTVSTGSQGYLVLMCNDGFREVSENSEGQLNEVSERTEEMETEVPEIEQEVSIEDALTQTDEIEQNLEGINQVIDEVVPERIASIIMGDKVNFQVDNTTIGIATNDSGVTGVEENGYEDPTLEISTTEETLREIMGSENAPETFREAYHGEGISVEAYSMKNKLVFGLVNTSSRIYGFVNRFM